jgi:Domain of unknown function (DUF4390)
MRARPILLLAGALAIGLAASAGAAEPRIRDLSIALEGGQVLVSFRLDGGFSDDLVRRIESGLPTGFTYELDLARDRKRWWDDSIANTRLEVVAMFNAITREYLVNTKIQGKLIDSRTLRDLGDLERAMTRFTALPVFSIEPGGSRSRYLLRARVELGTGHVLGFIPFLRTTDWVESNKVRVRTP